MPTPLQDAGSGDPSQTGIGAPVPAPASQAAPPTLNNAPTVSTTPGPGQGVAITIGGSLPVSAPATAVVVLTADPSSPHVGQIWYRSDTSQLSIQHNATTIKRVTFA